MSHQTVWVTHTLKGLAKRKALFCSQIMWKGTWTKTVDNIKKCQSLLQSVRFKNLCWEKGGQDCEAPRTAEEIRVFKVENTGGGNPSVHPQRTG